MGLEGISAMGSEGAPDTSDIEAARIKKLQEVAEANGLKFEDVLTLGKSDLPDTAFGKYGGYRLTGNINGVAIELTKPRGGDETRVLLDGIPQRGEAASVLMEKLFKLAAPAEEVEKINERAMNDTIDHMLLSQVLAGIK